MQQKSFLTTRGIKDAQNSALNPVTKHKNLYHQSENGNFSSNKPVEEIYTINIYKQKNHKWCPQHWAANVKKNQVRREHIKIPSRKSSCNASTFSHYLTPTTTWKSSSSDLLIYFWKLNLLPGAKWTYIYSSIVKNKANMYV